MTDLISVVIPTYNRVNVIGRAVESVFLQEYPYTEIIVVDDGSEDDTASSLKRYGDRVTLISQKNQGISAARNAGVRASRGSFVAFLDSDDEWYPQKLRAQQELLANHPHVALTCSAAEYVDENGKVHQRGGTARYGNVFGALLYSNFIVTSSVVVRKERLRNIEPLFRSRSQTGGGAEDWELWIRLAARNHFIVSGNITVRVNRSTDSDQRRYSPEAWMSAYAGMYADLGSDPVVGPRLEGQWRRVTANVHLLTASHAYYGRNWAQARKAALRAIAESPRGVRWRTAITILLLPPAVRDTIARAASMWKP